MTARPDRRTVLRGLAAGSAVGAAWTLPQVISVPAAGAQTCSTCGLAGDELVVNGSNPTYQVGGNPDYDADLASACNDTTGNAAVPEQWTTSNGLRVITYGHCASDQIMPGTADLFPAPSPAPAAGDVMFSGSMSNSAVPARAFQDLDVASCAAEIDGPGGVGFTLRAYLGGNPGIATEVLLQAAFFSGSPGLPPPPNQPLPTGDVGTPAVLGPIVATSLPTTRLVEQQVTATLPTGTRVVQLALQITTTDGLPVARNTGCADLISFVLC